VVERLLTQQTRPTVILGYPTFYVFQPKYMSAVRFTYSKRLRIARHHDWMPYLSAGEGIRDQIAPVARALIQLKAAISELLLNCLFQFYRRAHGKIL
jgi:hypothetical protein